MSILVTVFVGAVLSLASVTFSRDTQKHVIKPITNMVRVIQNLAETPLGKDDDFEELNTAHSAATPMLEQTIGKVGSLIQMGFGEDGSAIIRRNIDTQGEIELTKKGEMTQIIIGYVKIQKFGAVTDALQEEVMVFLNKICSIVHECSVEWYGCP